MPTPWARTKLRDVTKLLIQARNRLKDAQDFMNHAHLICLKERIDLPEVASKMLYEIHITIGCIKRLLDIAIEQISAIQ